MSQAAADIWRSPSGQHLVDLNESVSHNPYVVVDLGVRARRQAALVPISGAIKPRAEHLCDRLRGWH